MPIRTVGELTARSAGGASYWPDPGEIAGRPLRRFRVGVSAEALALAWAHMESAPHGAAVIVEHELSGRNRLGEPWGLGPDSTLSFAVILRPTLSDPNRDAVWLASGLAAAEGLEALSGRSLAVWWPDCIVERDSHAYLGHIYAEVELGPGGVQDAVTTFRMDLRAIGSPRQEDAIEAVLEAMERHFEHLDSGDEGLAVLAADYSRRCALLGCRVKARLMPKGETRGIFNGVEPSGCLELASATGMMERLPVDVVRALELR